VALPVAAGLLDGQLQPQSLGPGINTLSFPDGVFPIMPVPTCDLEAAYQATGAANVVAYSALVALLTRSKNA
jgi:hypothetical protein